MQFLMRKSETMTVGDDADSHFNEISRIYNDYLKIHGNIEEAIRLTRERIPDLSEEIEETLMGQSADDPISVPPDFEEWYEEHDDDEYWPAYRGLISGVLPELVVKSIHNSTKHVVQYISDPLGDPNPKYGLVVGHVQSGKTAHYTGVLARAADAGYKLIVVFAGSNSNLRNQTQKRLSRQLTGTLEDPLEGRHIHGADFSKQWHQVTTVTDVSSGRVKDEGDVSGALANLDINMFEDDRPILVVTKKVPAPLDELNRWLEHDISEEIRNSLSLLVIDDECDYASVDTSDNETANRINRGVRQLLSLFERRTYLGYTATPYANVLTALEAPANQNPSLYPRDFIIALNAPLNYQGIDTYFPQYPDIQDIYGEPVHCKVCLVPLLEANTLWSLTDTITETADLPPSLKIALVDHLLTGAIKASRVETQGKHHSMLIHTRERTDNMHPILLRVQNLMGIWENCFTKQEDYLVNHEIDEIRLFEQRYCEEYCEKWIHKDKEGEVTIPPDFLEIRDWISTSFRQATFNVLEVSSDQNYATDELDYDSPIYRENGLNVIVIGGQKLSRGLTLEGLTVSFFLRDANRPKYDTLMQMGRWFGFRIGYDDLVRIHTTGRLIEAFTYLGEVESYLRDSIERYRDTGLTPRDFGVRVMKVCDWMVPTKRDAMRAASEFSLTMDRVIIPQTGKFHHDKPEILEDNLRETAGFINGLGEKSSIFSRIPNADRGTIVWDSVPNAVVMEYLEEMSNIRNHRFPDDIYKWEGTRDYIGRRVDADKGEFVNWDVALISKEKGDFSQPYQDFGCEHHISTQVRSRQDAHLPSTNTGVVYGPRDTSIGLPGQPTDYYSGTTSNRRFDLGMMWNVRQPNQPLLLIYTIDRNSQAPQGNSSRVAIFGDNETPVDIVCPVIVIPPANLTFEERQAEARGFWALANLPSSAPEN